jgi:hypothetical protein
MEENKTTANARILTTTPGLLVFQLDILLMLLNRSYSSNISPNGDVTGITSALVLPCTELMEK